MSKVRRTGMRSAVVAFSAGDPPHEDFLHRGVGPEHLDDGVLQIARAVLRLEYDIAYAGDLRGTGFTSALSDDTGTVVLGPRFVSFLGWPFHQSLTPGKIADTLGLCRHVMVPAPESVQRVEPFSKTPEFGWAMAQATTKTRRELFARRVVRDIDGGRVEPRVAQVLVAGKSRGFLGVMLGIAEEAILALRARLGVFVIGAFGGAAALLAQYICGGSWPKEFTVAEQAADENFARMRQGAADSGCADAPADAFEDLRKTLGKVRADLGRLNNGLNARDNKELMRTDDLGKVARLITKGLIAMRPSSEA